MSIAVVPAPPGAANGHRINSDECNKKRINRTLLQQGLKIVDGSIMDQAIKISGHDTYPYCMGKEDVKVGPAWVVDFINLWLALEGSKKGDVMWAYAAAAIAVAIAKKDRKIKDAMIVSMEMGNEVRGIPVVGKLLQHIAKRVPIGQLVSLGSMTRYNEKIRGIKLDLEPVNSNDFDAIRCSAVEKLAQAALDIHHGIVTIAKRKKEPHMPPLRDGVSEGNDGDQPISLGTGMLIKERDKSILVSLEDGDGEEMWIPKSVIHDDSEVYGDGEDEQEGNVVVKKWWAEERNLV